MKQILGCFLAGLALAACGKAEHASEKTPQQPVRVAVIGGMTMTGMWQRISQEFERECGVPVELVVTGPKEVIVPAMKNGAVDFLTMHSSDEATSLVADGYAMNLRPWTRNEQVIVGPSGDPAGIRGMRDGAAALRKIASSRSPFVDAQGGGRRMVMERLWEKSGIRPVGDWVLKDESENSTGLLLFAESKGAYAVCGRIPVLTGKIPRGSMEILVEGDPDMQRPFVMMAANPRRFPNANVAGTSCLMEFLGGAAGQKLLEEIAAEQPAGLPLFYPLIDFVSPPKTP